MKKHKSCLLLCIAVSLCLVGSCLLLAFGFLFLHPYLSMGHLTRTMCTVTGHVISSYLRCTCFSGGHDCLSRFPCVRVIVSVNLDNGHVAKNLTLYDSMRSFQLLHGNFKCSIQECDPRTQRNVMVIKTFVDKYRDGIKVPCYHAPYHPDYGIIEVISIATVVNSVLWPSLALIIGILLLLGVIFQYPACLYKSNNHKRRGHSMTLTAYNYKQMKTEVT